MLLAERGGADVIALDGSGWAPAAASTAGYVDRGFATLPWNTPHAVTVPGAVAAWDAAVRAHGRLGLDRLLQPAIRAAADGFAVTERVAFDWRRKVAKLAANTEAARVFLPGGDAPAFGSRFANPQLAEALRSIAAGGADAFYRGWIAEDIVQTLQALDGLHRLDDFAEFSAEFVAPICASYRDHAVWQCPPAGVGVVALLIARVLERFDLAALPPLGAQWIHLVGEAGRLAYASRRAVLGDPRERQVPVENLLSDAFVAALADRIDVSRRLDTVEPVTGLPHHRETALVTVIDRDRNVAVLICSNFDDFGSGIVTRRSGIVLQNRGCGFLVQPGHPNTVEGRKRPLHTIIPGLISKDGLALGGFGVTGGQFQPSGQIQLLSHLLDHGFSLQHAIDCPRFFSQEERIDLEAGMPSGLASDLIQLGYDPVPAGDTLGTGHAVSIDWASGVLHGAADARRDGLALGW
jgi:gamma-glutamyltranspeptidase/glutathione hydrolase